MAAVIVKIVLVFESGRLGGPCAGSGGIGLGIGVRLRKCRR